MEHEKKIVKYQDKIKNSKLKNKKILNLLSDIIGFYVRENKPKWRQFFDRRNLSDDELFERGVMQEIEEQIIPCYKKLWFLDIVNVLDKDTWENLDDENNPLNKLYYIDGIELKALKDAKIMARTIKTNNLLHEV